MGRGGSWGSWGSGAGALPAWEGEADEESGEGEEDEDFDDGEPFGGVAWGGHEGRAGLGGGSPVGKISGMRASW